jgi:hypothetical protein
MKAHITAAALVLAVPTFSPMYAQTSGVSHPDSAVISSTDDAAPVTPRPLTPKPSAATQATIPATAPSAASSSQTAEYGPYVPYAGASTTGSASAVAPENDLDAMIVTDVPERDGELREGTLLKTRIRETLSTQSTVRGSRFSAELTEPIERKGRVIIPAGAILEGQVTEVRGGHRVTGAAALHLETRDILLPDGTHYVVHAQLIDTGKSEFKVTDEGTLKRKDNVKETLVVAGGVTGAGAVAGAMLGGGVGAVVGAGIGAGVSTVLWLKEDRQGTLPKDVKLVFSLTTPMILTPLSASPNTAMNAGGAGAAQ